MSSENRRLEHDLGATEVLADLELAAFLDDLEREDKLNGTQNRLRVDLSEPNMIVINTKDGRLIDKLPRSRFIEGQVDGAPGLRISTLDHIIQLLNRG